MNLPKLLIVMGLGVATLGVLLWILPRIPGFERLGRLPGDLHFQGKNVSFYFPLATCVLLSLALTLVLKLVGCTRKPDTEPEKTRIEAQIKQMEEDAVVLEKRTRTAANDPGLKNQLTEDLELLKSRIERLREKIPGGGASHGGSAGKESTESKSHH